MKVRVVIQHAAFDVARREGVRRVFEAVDRDLVDLIVHEEKVQRGSLPGCLEYMHDALGKCSHLVILPDDAILPRNFTKALMAAISARPNDLLCFQANHEKAKVALAAGYHWYSTTDGFTNFGGTYPQAILTEYLAWRDHALLRPDVDASKHWQGANADEAVNLWCLDTGRKVFKALPGLVGHDLLLQSLDGNQVQTDKKTVFRDNVTPRVSDATPYTDVSYWTKAAIDLGPTYQGHHWGLLLKLRGQQVRKAYQIEHENRYKVMREQGVL